MLYSKSESAVIHNNQLHPGFDMESEHGSLVGGASFFSIAGSLAGQTMLAQGSMSNHFICL